MPPEDGDARGAEAAGVKDRNGSAATSVAPGRAREVLIRELAQVEDWRARIDALDDVSESEKYTLRILVLGERVFGAAGRNAAARARRRRR